MIYKAYLNQTLFFDSSSPLQELMVTDASLELSLNTSGSFEFTIYPNNIIYEQVSELTSFVDVYRDNELLFSGRVYSIEKDIQAALTVVCEGGMAFLNDSVLRADTFQCSLRELVDAMLTSHNSQVTADKYITVGEFTMTGNVYRAYEDYKSTISRLKDLHDTFGGYITVNKTSTGWKLNWVHDLERRAEQKINFGSNMLDIEQTNTSNEIATVLIPLGSKVDEPDGSTHPLTIASINEGRDYIEADETAMNHFGRIVATYTWRDVTEPENLYRKGVEWLANHSQYRINVKVSAVDLTLAGYETETWRLGDNIRVVSTYHNLNELFLCQTLTLNLVNPAESTMELGTETVGFVQSGGNRLSGIANSVENLQGVLYTDYLKAHQIETDYLKTENLDAEAANIGLLKAESVVAEGITVTDLVGKNANIENILAGHAGTGTLQSIHLSAENTVIADATIVDAMIDSLRANKITAGTIYTNLVNIASADGHLNVDGSTIQIKDNNDVVRVQIGYDGTDYSLYIWGENGELLWQPTGITGEGIGSGKVKDYNVAENAGIKGSKLDIESVGTALNNSTFVIDASKVTINDSTLSAQYQQIITDIKGLQGQISGDIDTFFGDDVPTLENYPFTEWQNEATKNLLPFPYFDNVGKGNPRVINGITWTLNTDGSVTASGKATGLSKFTLQSYTDGRIFPAGSYAISGCPEGGSDSTYYMQAQVLSESSESTAVVGRAIVGKAKVGNSLFDSWLTDYGTGAVGTLENDSVINIELAIANGKVVDNLTFYPQLESGEEVTEYQTANKFMKRIGDIYIVGADGGEYAGKTFRFVWDPTNTVFYWQQLSDNEISDLYNKVTTLETGFDVIQGQIASKVWQTDIDYSVSQITDQYAQLTQTVDGITSEVGNLKTSANSFNTRISTVEQTANGLATRVSATEQSITSQGSRIRTAETNITQNATNISLKLTATDFNGKNIATKINTSADYVDITTNKFRIKAGSIDINSGNFKVDTNGNLYCSNVDLTGKITATSGTFRGTVYASAGEFTGTITSSSGKIGGWTIGSDMIYKEVRIGDTTYRPYIYAPANPSAPTTCFGVRAYNNTTGAESYPFHVTYDGIVRASNADITGNINAKGGTISGFNIDTFHLYTMNEYPHMTAGSIQFVMRSWAGTLYYGNDHAFLIQKHDGRAYNPLFLATYGGVCGAISFVQYSDRKVKHEIIDLDLNKSAEFVYKLKPVHYRLNVAPDEVRHGFVAQDVEVIAYDKQWNIIKDNPNGGNPYKSMDYTELLADMVATIQTQHERIKKLEEIVLNG